MAHNTCFIVTLMGPNWISGSTNEKREVNVYRVVFCPPIDTVTRLITGAVPWA